MLKLKLLQPSSSLLAKRHLGTLPKPHLLLILGRLLGKHLLPAPCGPVCMWHPYLCWYKPTWTPSPFCCVLTTHCKGKHFRNVFLNITILALVTLPAKVSLHTYTDTHIQTTAESEIYFKDLTFLICSVAIFLIAFGTCSPFKHKYWDLYRRKKDTSQQFTLFYSSP